MLALINIDTKNDKAAHKAPDKSTMARILFACTSSNKDKLDVSAAVRRWRKKSQEQEKLDSLSQ